MKYNIFFLMLLCFAQTVICQNKYEREFKINKKDFPVNAYSLIQDYLSDAKRIRFYRETDGIKNGYEAKFKRGRLHYSVEFDSIGVLEDVEFKINEIDIPEETWSSIMGHLNKNFNRCRVKKIQQQYPYKNGSVKKTLHEAFQNLILPYINYEIVFTCKNANGYQSHEALFNADGRLLKIRKSLVTSHDPNFY